MHRVTKLLSTLLLLLVTAACQVEPKIIDGDSVTHQWNRPGNKHDSGSWMDGDPVQLAMVQVRHDVTTTDYWALLANGALEETTHNESDRLSGQVRRALFFGLERSSKKIKGEHLRVWRYNLRADIRPGTIRNQGLQSKIGFRMRMGRTVEFARAFKSDHQANQAEALTLMDVPHDADSALALPFGTVASLPVEAQMSVDVSGLFLTRSASRSAELKHFLSTSAVGSTSGIRQGSLLIDGEFLIQVIRLEESQVRLRVLTGMALSANASAMVSAVGAATYRFIPSTVMDRARSIQVRVERAHRKIREIRAKNVRIEALRKDLTGKMELVMDATGISEHNPKTQGIREFATGTKDWAFDLVNNVSSISQLDETVVSYVDDRLQTVMDGVNKHIVPVMDTIKRYSSRAYHLNASVQLSDNFARTVRTVADYEFDLSDPTARHAFERAISGRAVWIDSIQGFIGNMEERRRLADLTLSDEIANADQGSEQPRVKRHATAVADQRTRHFGVQVSGLWMSSGFKWDKANNFVELTDEQGQRSAYQARAWQLQQKASWIGGKKSESFASGAFVTQGSDNPMGGGYWFNWKRDFPQSTWKPVSTAIGEFINLLGPKAVKAGVPAMYDGEHEGQVSASLDVVFSGHIMTQVFDPAQTSDATLWKVFGDVAESFDNQYGLPTLMSPMRPAVLDTIEGGHEACEKVAYHFGGWYCFYFADKFVPALRQAQQSPDPADRLAFFEKFYKAGFFANPVGSRLLVRFVSSLVSHLGLDDQISFRAAIRNRADDSEAASPQLESGDAGALTLMESMTPDGMK